MVLMNLMEMGFFLINHAIFPLCNCTVTFIKKKNKPVKIKLSVSSKRNENGICPACFTSQILELHKKHIFSSFI